MNFQKICLLVAGILLVILFVVIIISFKNSNSQVIWPPITDNCPDYFTDINGDGSNCANTFDLGLNVGTNINFKTNYPSACDKYTFCNTNLLTWDGITYGYGLNNPCQTSSTSTTSNNNNNMLIFIILIVTLIIIFIAID
jgi:uncharacterized integral membrane protein